MEPQPMAMSETENALQAIIGLVVGGMIFVIFGSALAQTEIAANWSIPLDFRLWGANIVAAIALGGLLVLGAVIAFLND